MRFRTPYYIWLANFFRWLCTVITFPQIWFTLAVCRIPLTLSFPYHISCGKMGCGSTVLFSSSDRKGHAINFVEGTHLVSLTSACLIERDCIPINSLKGFIEASMWIFEAFYPIWVLILVLLSVLCITLCIHILPVT